jgi:hypothetical protein
MLTYEIRLLNGGGETVMIHVTACDTPEQALERLAHLDGVAYAHYEIWQGGQKLAEGSNGNP